MKLVFFEEKMRDLVNPKVLSMLESLEIGYLGVSLDALLLIAPPDAASDIMDAIRGAGVRIDVAGEVRVGEGTELVIDGDVRDFTPRFRELHTLQLRNSSARQRQRITSGCVRLSITQQRRRRRRGTWWWRECEARKLVFGAGVGAGVLGFWQSRRLSFYGGRLV